MGQLPLNIFYSLFMSRNVLKIKPRFVVFELCYIFGIGFKTAFVICKKNGFIPYSLISGIEKNQEYLFNQWLNKKFQNIYLFGSIKKLKEGNQMKFLYGLKIRRGIRQKKGLPVRGQRTKT